MQTKACHQKANASLERSPHVESPLKGEARSQATNLSTQQTNIQQVIGPRGPTSWRKSLKANALLINNSSNQNHGAGLPFNVKRRTKLKPRQCSSHLSRGHERHLECTHAVVADGFAADMAPPFKGGTQSWPPREANKQGARHSQGPAVSGP